MNTIVARWSMRVTLVATLALFQTAACVGHFASRPGVYLTHEETMALPRGSFKVTYVTPAKPRIPVSMILFATGDAGWWGASGAIFEHLAREGYYVAAYNSREIVKYAQEAEKKPTIEESAAAIDTVLVNMRRELDLPETTPVIVTGFSRGANLVLFTAAVKRLQRHLRGAIAIALTREMDYVAAPKLDQRPPEIKVDERGRIQTYPAIPLVGSVPFAVIQSRADNYVPGEEARQLFGPDTATRRLYVVDAKNHGFRGGKAEMLRDLDDALAWIENRASPE
jgi:dienelactone hydrolase